MVYAQELLRRDPAGNHKMGCKMRNGTCLSLALFAASLLLPALAGAQTEQWLQYRSAREADDIAGALGAVTLDLTDAKPPGVVLPRSVGENVVFARWSTPMAKSGSLCVAVDLPSESAAQTTLFIDSDGDRRLDDESAETAYRIDQYNAYFGPVKVTFQAEDGPVTYHLNVRFYGADSSRKRLYVSAGGWYEGDVTVDGVKKRCVLVDYNANGTFNDTSPDPEQCDRIRIGEMDVPNMLLVGKYLDLDGTLYEPEISRDGAFVKFARAEGAKYGAVRLAETVSGFSAGGENGQFTLRPRDGVARLPIGKYRVTEWTVERKDDSGAQWRLQGAGVSGVNAFEVSETEEAALEIGEPIVAVVQATEREGTHSFSQSLKGRHGERITLTRNGAQPQAPRLNIKNKDGTYDRTFSFSYG
jgi:hypothetical protein